jgi:hypothetical protein
MKNLLEVALEAHAGLTRWSQLKAVTADLSVTGALWRMKGQAGALQQIRIEAELHRQKLTTLFHGRDKRTTFTPDSVTLPTEGGRLLQSRANPRSSFSGQVLNSPWDELHVAYFNSYALWTYLTIPFLYTYPGFTTEELEPWHEDGEIWRALRATFPEGIASHTRQQISYFGLDGLLRRHEYTVDVLGGATGLNYAHDYRKADGISVPMKRRVYSHDADKRKIPDPVLVAIDVHAIAFSHS